MRASREGIYATRLVTILASNTAPDTVRDTNFEGNHIFFSFVMLWVGLEITLAAPSLDIARASFFLASCIFSMT